MDVYLAYGLALVIGAVMGLIGGGGSILTLPVFVYVLGMQEEVATGYSLFVVGMIALFGGIRYVIKKQVDFVAAIAFLIPSIPAVYLTRKYLVTAIPEVIFTSGDFEFTRGLFMMVLFAVVMLVAGISMITKKSNSDEPESHEKTKVSFVSFLKIALEGILVGVLTGLVGAGGGFIIVPALVLITKVPMKIAIGTSLVIIAGKSLLGFLGDVSQGNEMDWQFLLIFSAISVAGVFGGAYFNSKVPAKKLKKGFGFFVLAMAVVIMYKEFV